MVTVNKNSELLIILFINALNTIVPSIMLTDYQDFELLRRTKGRREVTEADEKAVKELCQPYLDWRKGALK